ncbi:MAG: hypothetical protein KDM64_11250 [Verrucomicrobiae bacterium]|nr:hypothetical protein [Verrucomicrobiae bacterium]
MDMITPDKVIAAIETYFNGGVISYLGKDSKPKIDLEAASKKAPTKNARSKGPNGRRAPSRNKMAYRFLGLRRSGIHPVLNWLIGLHRG